MDFPKKQAQRLMPLYLLEYSEKLFTNHPEADIKIRNSSYDGYQYPTIYSTKGLYVNLAKIKLGDDGNNTYGITMPDSSTWESDRVLATTDDIPSLTGYATET